jgi:hypothetical protein
MQAIRIEATIQTDGELRLAPLPCHKGERVEAIVLLPDRPENGDRQAARDGFLRRARGSHFRSEGPYPSRGELHERP